MASEWEIKDQQRRQKVARELDRRAFWKAVYVAAVSKGEGPTDSSHRADVALLDFDIKFKDLE